ncbi:MAG: septal ring lytic transglycosylase RlpA family protein [Flavobacteriales bacterium]|nr:septal ring lytic transglycosylase RlpA family protein [Flavobacteriales bacterium]
MLTYNGLESDTLAKGDHIPEIKEVYEVDFNGNNIEDSESVEEEDYKTARVSYYGGIFHGRKTANGETYNKHELTAAHKTLPFGTKVEFYNPKNGKKVVVEVNDRGPYVKGRLFDLSEGAFKSIMSLNRGVANIKYRILDNESENSEIKRVEETTNIKEIDFKTTEQASQVKRSALPIKLSDTLVVRI